MPSFPEEYIQTIHQYFHNQPVVRAWLFGSWSRGEANDTSDIDLLVELDYTFPVGLEFIQMQLDLQRLLSRKVDLVSSRGLSKYIKPIIEAEKKLLYARQAG
jgi:predicted nucleotidyltransferase